MMPKLDHIGIAVNSIEEASRLYTGPLGLTLDHVETVREEDVRVGFLLPARLELGPDPDRMTAVPEPRERIS